MTEGLTQYSADKKAANYLGKVNNELRQKAKAYCLGVPYGMSAFALGKTLDMSEKEAQVLINNYLNAFPSLKKWMNESILKCKLQGQVQSEAGRIRHMPTAKVIYAAHGDGLLNPLKNH